MSVHRRRTRQEFGADVLKYTRHDQCSPLRLWCQHAAGVQVGAGRCQRLPEAPNHARLQARRHPDASDCPPEVPREHPDASNRSRKRFRGHPDASNRSRKRFRRHPDASNRPSAVPRGHPDASNRSHERFRGHPDASNRPSEVPREHPDASNRSRERVRGHPEACNRSRAGARWGSATTSPRQSPVPRAAATPSERGAVKRVVPLLGHAGLRRSRELDRVCSPKVDHRRIGLEVLDIRRDGATMPSLPTTESVGARHKLEREAQRTAS